MAASNVRSGTHRKPKPSKTLTREDLHAALLSFVLSPGLTPGERRASFKELRQVKDGGPARILRRLVRDLEAPTFAQFIRSASVYLLEQAADDEVLGFNRRVILAAEDVPEGRRFALYLSGDERKPIAEFTLDDQGVKETYFRILKLITKAARA